MQRLSLDHVVNAAQGCPLLGIVPKWSHDQILDGRVGLRLPVVQGLLDFGLMSGVQVRVLLKIFVGIND